MPFAHVQLLLADAGQVIVAVIVSLIVLIRWVFSQIQDAKKQAARQRAQQQPMPRAEQQRPQRPQAAMQVADQRPPVAQQADPLRDQVEAFLRRAAQQQQQQQRPNKPRVAQRRLQSPVADRIEILLEEEEVDSERRTIAQPLRPLGQPEIVPQPAARRTSSVEPRRTSVADHVAEHVSASTRALSQHTSQLGQRIITEDEQFDVQLKAKFDHTLGTLAASGTTSTAPPTGSTERQSPAGQIAAMLASPDGIRQAVVLNEILRRPSDRW